MLRFHVAVSNMRIGYRLFAFSRVFTSFMPKVSAQYCERLRGSNSQISFDIYYYGIGCPELEIGLSRESSTEIYFRYISAY